MWPGVVHIFCLIVTFLLPRLMSLTPGALGLNCYPPSFLSACRQPAAQRLHGWKRQFHLAHAAGEKLSSSRVVTCAFQGCSARSYAQQWATWCVSRSLWGINCPHSVSFMSFLYRLRCLPIIRHIFNIVLHFLFFFTNPNYLMKTQADSKDLSLNLWPHAFLIEHDCSINGWICSQPFLTLVSVLSESALN